MKTSDMNRFNRGAGEFWQRLVGRITILAFAVLFTAGPAHRAWAATFVVNSPSDLEDDVPGDGNCAAREALSSCTLRAAIQESNALEGADVIQVPRIGTMKYQLRIPGPNEDHAELGDLDITDDLTILGTGSGGTGIGVVEINGGGASGETDRVFDIHPAAHVTLRNLVIRDGNLRAPGGGIRNRGTLRLENVTIRNNRVVDAAGAGVANVEGGILTIVNSTISTNIAESNGQGGGIANIGGTVSLDSVTLANNVASLAASGLYNLGGAISVHNTIIANNSPAPNCAGVPPVSKGFNIDSGVLCQFSGNQTDRSNVNISLGVLSWNGGASETHAIAPGNPALDTGDPDDCPATDQRGFPRPVDGNNDGIAICDVGAFELNPPTPTPTQTATYTPTVLTATPTHTATFTPTILTPTPTGTASPTPTVPSPTPSHTPLPTFTAPPSPTGSFTPTPSPTDSPAPPTDTATATATGTATASPTPTSTVDSSLPRVEVSIERGSPGDDVLFKVSLHTPATSPIVAAQTEVLFDSLNIPLVPRQDGTPDCNRNSELTKQFLVDYRPQGCVGQDCNVVRLVVYSSIYPLSAIPDGSVLYTCHIRISSSAPLSTYPLTVQRVILSDPEGQVVPGAQGIAGAVIVEARPTPTWTPTPTSTATQPPVTPTPLPCRGDCNGDREVTIEELIAMVNIALGAQPAAACANGDINRDGEITIDEIILAVNVALTACPPL